LYRLFLEVLEMPNEVSQPVIDLILQRTSIWFKPDVYAKLPVMLPWVVRDPKCRPHLSNGLKIPDSWAAPNKSGYLRDDNSLIKGIPKSLGIVGPKKSPLSRQMLGSSFVASHIWRVTNGSVLASRDPLLNSFVPNLVWLPAQVAKLSDLEGGAIQQGLKRLSWKMFRDAPVDEYLGPLVSEAWAQLPKPEAEATVDIEALHFFATTPKFLSTRAGIIDKTHKFLLALSLGQPLPPKGKIPSRYFEGMQQVKHKVAADVAASVGRHVVAF
jgi:hypothetical protein